MIIDQIGLHSVPLPLFIKSTVSTTDNTILTWNLLHRGGHRKMVSLDLLVMNQLMNSNLLHYYWSSQQTKELTRKLVLVKGHMVHGAKRNENAYFESNESISHESSYNKSHPVFLPGVHALGSTGPTEKLKRGHEGEKRVTIFRYS